MDAEAIVDRCVDPRIKSGDGDDMLERWSLHHRACITALIPSSSPEAGDDRSGEVATPRIVKNVDSAIRRMDGESRFRLARI